MEILVDVVRVAGFRGVKELEVNLSPVTVLIGMNNSGKTWRPQVPSATVS